MKIFSSAMKGEDGLWRTNKLAQMKKDCEEAKPGSWLQAVGFSLLLTRLAYACKTSVLFLLKSQKVAAAATIDNFIAHMLQYELPAGFAVDADEKNGLVETTTFDGKSVTQIDLLAFAKMASTVCEGVDDGSIELPEGMKLKAE